MTSFHATDPRTGRETGPAFAEASSADIRAAVRAASAAAPAFATATPTVVGGLLDRIAADLRAAGAEIIAVADAETALGERRLTGELERTCGQLELFARTVRAGTLFAARESTAAGAAPHLLRVGVPIGPVAVFAASNFPLAFSVAGGDTASAFAARCPVVVKAHPAHPRTSATVGAIVAEAVGAAGLPAGVFNLIQGRTPATSTELAAAAEIAAIAFTGSQFVGRALYDLAATRPVPVPVYAEMGSLNPVVVTPAALRDGVDETAQRLAASALDGWGQFCTKPGLIAVPADRAEAFTESLVKYMSGAAPGYLLSPGIRAHLVDRVAHLAALENVGVRTAHPGPGDGLAHPALVLMATAGAVAEHEALREETFGPVTMVVPVASIDEAIGLVRTLPGSLTGTVSCATDGTDDWAAEVAAALIPRVGRLVANGVPTGVAVVEAQHHGGPYPATAMSLYTSVGTAAVERFLRPVALQNVPSALLPPSITAWLE